MKDCTICHQRHVVGSPCPWPPFGPSKDEGSEDDDYGTRTVRRLVGAGALLLALTACGINSGTVVSKEYDDEDRYWTTVIVGKVPVMQMHTDPECWQLNLRDGEDTGSACVSHDKWLETRVGDYYQEPES